MMLERDFKNNTLILHDEDESGTLPAKRVICSRCNGDGQYTNPSIDGNGLSEESVGDSEFMEDYLKGIYDVLCVVCKGNKIDLEPDYERMTPNQHEQLEAYYSDCAAEETERRNMDLEYQSEVRFGC